MKLQTIASESLARAGRVDAGYHLAPGQLAAARLELARAAGVPLQKLGGADGVARVWSPNRFKRAYAAPGEESVPYLRPYDVFNYLPEPADFLSATRTAHLDTYRLRRGMILQTCSGRNLGPAVVVDACLAGFVLSHDMIRVEIDDDRTRFYVLAFLQSKAGQALLRRDKTGSVIDHLSDAHIAEQDVPMFPGIVQPVSDAMKGATRLREEARQELSALIAELEAKLPSVESTGPRCNGWTTGSVSFRSAGRIDAAFHDPLVSEVRGQVAALGGVALSTVAAVQLPGRFKRDYTISEENGRPMVSGSQLLESTPINLQFILPRSFREVADYELKAGWTAYAADGRVEESLGSPVLITGERDGWLASNHVGRVIPNPGVEPGWVYLSLKVRQSQFQLKAMASGSVVDSTYPWDMGRVVISPAELVDGGQVVRVWDKFRMANDRQAAAVREVDEALAVYNVPTATAVRKGRR